MRHLLRDRLVLALAGGAAGFHLWSAGVSPFTALVQCPVHLAFMAALAFLGMGPGAEGRSGRGCRGGQRGRRTRPGPLRRSRRDTPSRTRR